ncbi:SusC/RagA family TonB-linked outer membrane protein [Chitinophaga nivalis]|uniref:SusC/RagA family TonB-linked outer membrane protein n=1 Tax=Chitinophaga nivalis TaxID=2991709 RepID=A0ABT3IGS2_9BACT|nr:SusC/RagA family TonB-linked outer membrane protein [Chitinophaga nivalis]MCW3467142.1 SusC/RagA family TonB-linked outer membrane protein [Chitinophaga nivalis]MCW3483167.1 SusC/RagA family TonB-linked outer membrane protein [Chitinophaga nivalis]
MYLKKFTQFLLVFLFTSPALFAQENIITGQVKSATDGNILIGVSIAVKGKTTGAITDNNGNFRLALPTDASTLVFNYIGFIPQEIKITGNKNIQVQLTENIKALDAVVVTGLASATKRANLANAVTSISAKELTGTATPQTLDNALYGKIPGAEIKTNSGAPGGGLSVQLRGISSLQGASQPLYIIDGVYVNNTTIRTGRSTITGAGGAEEDDASNRLADINPDDVESVEVLKGASASAIYGTRANAGVIIINTKKGKAGRTRVSLSQETGFAKIQHYMGSAPWDENKIKLFFPASRHELELKRYREAVANNGIFDYEKMLYGGTPLLSNSHINISGGTEKTRFYVSGNLSREDGIIKNTGFGRKSIRLNLDHAFNSRINFTLNSNYINSNTDRGFTGNENNPGASLGYIIGYTPSYFNPYPNAKGVYPDNPYSESENPLALRDRAINNTGVNRFIQSAKLNINLLSTPKSSLSVALQGGVDYLSSRTKVYFPDDLQAQRSEANPGDIVIGTQQAINTNLQAFLIYQQTVNKINFSTQVGTVFLQTKSNSVLNRGRGLVAGQQNISQAAVQQLLQQHDQLVKDAGIVGQEEINFNDKVITTLGVRFDKSTLNGDANQYYAFPKASVAVNLTKFDFWKLPTVSQLKLRAAYGQTGGLASFGDTYSSLLPAVNGGFIGSKVSATAGNPNIKPERAGELELGTDIGLFNNRLNFEGTYYHKKVTDLIQDLTLSDATGIRTKKINAAELVNNGVELAITGVPVSRENFTWTSRALFWKNTTKITRLNVPSYTSGSYGPTFGTYLVKEGYSPTTIVGIPQTAPGQYTVFGNSQPDFQSSLYNEIRFLRDFNFSFLLHWKKGGDLLNITLYNTDNGGTTKDWNGDDNNNGVPNGKDRHTGSAGVYVQDASYLRLREVNLSYTFPKTLISRTFHNVIENIRVGVSATNLFTITSYPGYDPEVSSFGTQVINTGTDLFQYPSSKRILFNVKVDF